ncbi:hypothetical protein ABDK00_017625 [Niabella insulamsoli]|uniref:hypothetical protein n=1 Tax=Niabella insulamsoli TaxID=3144874 RepID=UPI0031FD5A2C
MRNLFCLLLTFIASTVGFGQTPDKNTIGIIKLNLTSLLDETTFPTINVSLEKKISRTGSLTFEAGYQIYSIGNSADTSFVNNRGFKLAFEFRHYLNQKDVAKLTGYYIAANIFQRSNQYTEDLMYSLQQEKDNPNQRLEDEFVVKKSVTGLNFVLGKQSNPTAKTWLKKYKGLSKIFIDPYIGLGIFYRQVKNERREFEEGKHERYKSRHPNAYDIFASSGLAENTGFRPSLIGGIRLGIML